MGILIEVNLMRKNRYTAFTSMEINLSHFNLCNIKKGVSKKKLERSKLNKAVHIGFDVVLFCKSAIALIEIICGIVLIFLPPDKMNTIVDFITKNELLEDPNDFLANLIEKLIHNFSLSFWSFFIIYLLSHGIIKATVLFLLWRKKLWAYPLSIIVFIGFIAYQCHKYLINHSAFLMLLTILDVAMIILTILEYRQVRKRSKT